MSFADHIIKSAGIDVQEYPTRLAIIFKAYETCKRDNVPVGRRLDKICTLYDVMYGGDAFSGTICPVTNEAEIMALIIKHIPGIKTDKLIEQAPLLAAQYEHFKNSGVKDIDTKSLYEYLKPELEMHLKRYSIPTKEN